MPETETAIELALRTGTYGVPVSDQSPIPRVTVMSRTHSKFPRLTSDKIRKTSPSALRAPPGRVLIDRETMLAKLAISDATLRRKMDKGVLPRPVEIGSPYCLRWYLDEVDEAIARLTRQQGDEGEVEERPGQQPRDERRGRKATADQATPP